MFEDCGEPVAIDASGLIGSKRKVWYFEKKSNSSIRFSLFVGYDYDFPKTTHVQTDFHFKLM